MIFPHKDNNKKPTIIKILGKKDKVKAMRLIVEK
jgi:hypothetical protein